MKKITITLAIILLSIFTAGFIANEQTTMSKLTYSEAFMNDNNFIIEGVIIKRITTLQAPNHAPTEQEVQQLFKTADENHGAIHLENEAWIATKEKMSTKSRIVLSRDGRTFVRVDTLTLQGWTKATQKEVAHWLNEDKGENTQIYTCMKGVYNGKMDKGLSDWLSDTMKAHSLAKISGTDEGTFVTASAYNALWMDGLQTNSNKKTNVHFALKTETDGTRLWIGTPLLTIEY
ncbi:MAG: YwmB family TATA-box binding protein [Bacilli bacterium]